MSEHNTSEESLQFGHTLVEMIVVVAIVAIIASLAVATVSPSEDYELNLAASEVADAFRFAREKTRHTGVIHGVSTDRVDNTVRVFRLDERPDPNLKIFDVYHPISKQLYTIQIGESPYRKVTLSGTGGELLGGCSSKGDFAIDSIGTVRCINPLTTRIRDTTVELALGRIRQTVLVDEYTGRVSIQ